MKYELIIICNGTTVLDQDNNFQVLWAEMNYFFQQWNDGSFKGSGLYINNTETNVIEAGVLFH